MDKTAFFLILSVVVLLCGGQRFLSGYDVSCYRARQVHSETANFCPMVQWLSGSLFNSSTFSVYYPGSAQDLNEQNSVAVSISEELLAMSTGAVSDTCRSAVKRFACVTSFPYCQTSGSSVSSISYLPPCRLQCEHVRRICKATLFSEKTLIDLDCSEFSLDRNCMLYVPVDRFFLDPAQVSYFVQHSHYATVGKLTSEVFGRARITVFRLCMSPSWLPGPCCRLPGTS